MKRSQILALTRCRFYIWHKNLNACEVTKKALRAALRKDVNYAVETEVTYTDGKGRNYYKCVIIL